MYARVSRRAYTPFHAMPCQAMQMQEARHEAMRVRAHLESRDRLLSQDHRYATSHCPHHPWRSSRSSVSSFISTTSYQTMQRGGDRGRGRGGPDRGRGFRGGGGRGGPVPGGRGRGGYVTFTFLCYSNSWLVSIFAEGQPAVIDSRLSNSAEDRLISSFKSLSLRQDARPPRPDYGQKG